MHYAMHYAMHYVMHYGLQVSEHSADAVTLQWVFTDGCPDDCSAWVGLFDAEEFDWAAGDPRPRYTKYATLTSSKQLGSKRC